LFATQGLEVTLNDIAHHAGVGVGTAYRRFSNKEEVIEALFEESIEDMVRVAEETLAAPDAWEGLVSYLERSLSMRFGDRGLSQILNNPALGNARVAELRDRIAPLHKALVDRAKEQGFVREDLDQNDIIFIQVALSPIMERSRTIEPDLYRRYLTLFLDGIRAGNRVQTPLPTGPLTVDQTHEAMTSGRPGRH
jgi:AcrR family transcriptional regulator